MVFNHHFLSNCSRWVSGTWIFQPEIIEQRFGAVVLPHHDQQASDDGESKRAWAGSLPSNMLLLESNPANRRGLLWRGWTNCLPSTPKLAAER